MSVANDLDLLAIGQVSNLLFFFFLHVIGKLDIQILYSGFSKNDPYLIVVFFLETS